MFRKVAASLLVGLSGVLTAASCDRQACLREDQACIGECTELCLERYVDRFDQPILVYLGPESGAPTCESFGMRELCQGWSDPLDEPACGPCHCRDNGCPLNTRYQLNSDRDCGVPTASGAVDYSNADLECLPQDGAALPPTASVALVSVLDFDFCRGFRVEGEFAPDKTWKTFVRACDGTRADYTCDYPPVRICVAKPPTPDFHVCVFPFKDEDGREVDESAVVCPEQYPEKHVFYRGGSFYDGCGFCICEPLGGRTCLQTVSLYADGACAELVERASLAEPGCIPLASPARIGGLDIEATPITTSTCVLVRDEPPPPSMVFEPELPKVACCQPSSG